MKPSSSNDIEFLASLELKELNFLSLVRASCNLLLKKPLLTFTVILKMLPLGIGLLLLNSSITAILMPLTFAIELPLARLQNDTNGSLPWLCLLIVGIIVAINTAISLAFFKVSIFSEIYLSLRNNIQPSMSNLFKKWISTYMICLRACWAPILLYWLPFLILLSLSYGDSPIINSSLQPSLHIIFSILPILLSIRKLYLLQPLIYESYCNTTNNVEPRSSPKGLRILVYTIEVILISLITLDILSSQTNHNYTTLITLIVIYCLVTGALSCLLFVAQSTSIPARSTRGSQLFLFILILVLFLVCCITPIQWLIEYGRSAARIEAEKQKNRADY